MQSRMYQGIAEASKEDIEKVKKAMALRPELIRTMFKAIEKDYGTIEAFYQQELGIGEAEKEILKSRFTTVKN